MAQAAGPVAPSVPCLGLALLGFGFVGFALLFAPRVERLKLEDGGPCFLFITLVWGPASFLIHTLLRWPGQAFDPGIDFGGELVLELLGAAVWSAASLYW